jgi:hypothetical protein
VNALVIRASSSWRRPADHTLGECHVALRLAAYAHARDAAGLRRHPEHQLRVTRGLQLQRDIAFRPIPPHRALVPAGALNRHERHPLPH